MAFEERVQILSEAEQDELMDPRFRPPPTNASFSLNDKELAIAKPPSSGPALHAGGTAAIQSQAGGAESGFHQIKQDLKYVYQTVYQAQAVDPLISRQRERTDLPTRFPALQLTSAGMSKTMERR